MAIWTPEQFSAFLEACPASWRLLFTFLYTTGCRRGEMMALTWADVHDGRAWITKSVSHHSGQGWTVTPTKNDGSNRSVILADDVASALEERRAELNPASDAFVFGGAGDGRNGAVPVAPETLRRTMQTAAAAAGVPQIRVHDLRHSCASFLLHSGVSIVAVSKHLGHTNTQQTLDTYAHMLPADDDLVRSALSGAVKKF